MASLPMQLHNCYWVLRHGTSKANKAGIIVSSLHNGQLPDYGLAEEGQHQAREAGACLQSHLQELRVPASALVAYASPFSRTQQTAAICLGSFVEPVNQDNSSSNDPPQASASCAAPTVQPTEMLRERYFGAQLELQPHSHYASVWEQDAESIDYRPGGDGESVRSVSLRVQQLFEQMEARHRDCHVLLVAHGDTLSILEATVRGSNLRQHRHHGLATGQLRRLN